MWIVLIYALQSMQLKDRAIKFYALIYDYIEL